MSSSTAVSRRPPSSMKRLVVFSTRKPRQRNSPSTADGPLARCASSCDARHPIIPSASITRAGPRGPRRRSRARPIRRCSAISARSTSRPTRVATVWRQCQRSRSWPGTPRYHHPQRGLLSRDLVRPHPARRGGGPRQARLSRAQPSFRLVRPSRLSQSPDWRALARRRPSSADRHRSARHDGGILCHSITLI